LLRVATEEDARSLRAVRKTAAAPRRATGVREEVLRLILED
jgi:hypothetical protein